MVGFSLLLKAAFVPGQHVARQHVVVNMFLVSAKFVASLLPVMLLDRQQRDTSIQNEQIVAGQHVARPDNMLP